MDQMLKVIVVQILRGRVLLGFEAAEGVAVHRWEVWEKIRARAPKNLSEAEVMPVA
jgi:sRNA-binding carbon storage regulator CsrA